MTGESALTVLWRRKWTIVATFLVFAIASAAVSSVLPKVYSTQATMLIGLPADEASFDSVRAGQAIARSYADIIGSPNLAEQVARRVGGGATQRSIAGATTFDAELETQLLKVTAEDRSPRRAKQIADTYAGTFIRYARRELSPTTEATISLADPAPLPGKAARPQPMVYTLIGALFGLALGVALAFLRQRVDRRLRTAEDVETHFNVPILARVPRRGRSHASRMAFQEAERVLRTNLQFATVGARLSSVAVTSGAQGEGKTTTVMNLALASVETGARVIVVEADLRRPGLQAQLLPDLEAPLRPGLSNYLVEAAPLEDVIHSTGRPNLSLVPAGPLPPSPSGLLESRRGRTAVRDFLTQADLVIVDSPPLSVGADASVISGWVDGVVVLCDLHVSTDRTLRDALRQLEAIRANVLGLVINRDRGAEPAAYDYYLSGDSSKKARSGRERSATGSRS